MYNYYLNLRQSIVISRFLYIYLPAHEACRLQCHQNTAAFDAQTELLKLETYYIMTVGVTVVDLDINIVCNVFRIICFCKYAGA